LTLFIVLQADYILDWLFMSAAQSRAKYRLTDIEKRLRRGAVPRRRVDGLHLDADCSWEAGHCISLA